MVRSLTFLFVTGGLDFKPIAGPVNINLLVVVSACENW